MPRPDMPGSLRKGGHLMIYCSSCGCYQSKENAFCSNCGAKLLKPEETPQTPQRDPWDTPEETKKPTKKGLYLIIYAVCFLAVMVGLIAITRAWPSNDVPLQGTYTLALDGPADDPCNFLSEDTVLERNIGDVVNTLIAEEDYFFTTYGDYDEYLFYPDTTYLGVGAEDLYVELDVDPSTQGIFEAFYCFALEDSTAFDRFDEMVDQLVEKYGEYTTCYRINEDGSEETITREEMMEAIRSGEENLFSVDWDMTVPSQEQSITAPLDRDGRYMYILLHTSNDDDGYTYGWTGIS